MGLPGAPKVKFLSKEMAKQKKNASHSVANLQSKTVDKKAAVEESSEEEDGDEDSEEEDSSSEEEDVADGGDNKSQPAEKVFDLSVIGGILVLNTFNL